jgi:zinc protease
MKTNQSSLIKIIRNASVLLFVLFITACSSNPARKTDPYAGLGNPSDPIPFMENVRTGKLSNGLTYFILENAKPENRAYLTMAVDAGSVQENDDEQGLAHFVEHMAFNGTEHFPKSELLDYLRSLGMRFGPEVNAYTSFDETVYGIEVPVEVSSAGKKTVPAKALQVISDWASRITIAPEDVEAERGVILEEYRTRLNAQMRVWKKTLPIMYEDTLYAERDPIGLREIIETAPAQRLMDFYKRWYRPDNMALIFVGDFDGAELEAELENYFNAEAPSSVLEKPQYDLALPQKGKFRAEIITDPEFPYAGADFLFKQQPRAIGTDLAFYRQELIESLISRMLSLRFNEASSKPETPFAAIGASFVPVAKSSRYYMMSGIAKPGLIKETMNAVLLAKESMERYGFTQAEIDMAKRATISFVEQMAAEQDRQESATFINYLASHYLTGMNLPDINWELEAIRKLLPGIEQQEVNAAVKSFFTDDDLAVIVAAPEADAASLPDAAAIQTMVNQAANANIEAPIEETFNDDLIPIDPVPGKIISEKVDDKTNVTEWMLSNGAKVLFMPTANQNNEVSFYALAKGGISSAADEDYYSVSVASDLYFYSGAGDFSLTDLSRILADKQTSLSSFLSLYNRGLQGSSSTEDLKTILELIYLKFTQPKITDDAAAVALDQYRTILMQRQENPEAYFSDELQRVLYSNYPKTLPIQLADLEKISVDAAESFLKKSMNPSDYTFVFTGNIDEAELRQLTEAYIASIPVNGNPPFNTWTDMQIPKPGKQEKNVYKGQEERSLVYMGWYVPMTYSEKDSIDAAALSAYLDIRLVEEIREKLGGVYGITPSASLTPMPSGELALTVVFYCDPARTEELAAAVVAELSLIAQGMINSDTLTKSKEALKKNFEESMQNNSYIARNIAMYDQVLQIPLPEVSAMPELYDSVKAEDLQNLSNLLQTNGGPLKMILYPESWK